MTDERKKELFPYFAYAYSQQLNPEKYGSVTSFDEWSQLLEDSPEDAEKIISAASALSDDQWDSIEKQYSEPQSDNTSDIAPEEQEEVKTTPIPTIAKKGAKLNYLKKLKSGKSMAKKCSCGCDMTTVKEKGGKLTSKCACGCSTPKMLKYKQGKK